MKKKMFMFMSWIKISLTILILFTILYQPAFAQVGEPTVNVALINNVKNVDVGPDDNGTVIFPGIVSVSMNGATRVIVNLTAIDTWNSAIVTPKSIVFTEKADKPFTVKVTAPLGTSFDGIGVVTVTGIWTSEPGRQNGSANPVSGAFGRIDINPFFKFSLKSKESSKNVIVGSEIQFELIISNEGNFIDTFTIDIMNLEELSTNGIDVDISDTNVELSENENETIIISIKANKNIKQGDKLIHIQIMSNIGITKGTPQQNLTYKLKIKKDPKDNQDSPIPNLTKVLSEPFSILIILLFTIVIGILLSVYWIKKRNKNP